MIECIDLKLARTYANKTVSEVARAMKKSRSWVSQTESGTRRIHADDLQKLMELYGLDDTPLNRIKLNSKNKRLK